MLLTAANAFWRELSTRLVDVVIRVEGGFGPARKVRLITFHDTAKQHLNAARYILRERRDRETGRRELTLKFRHPDRHIAQARTMTARGFRGAATKFEEDIKTPFVSLYSFSTTIQLDGQARVARLGDVGRMFPDLTKRLGRFPDAATLGIVNGFTAREVALLGPELRIARGPKVDAECALIVWYDDNSRTDEPVAVEFSYRYADPAEHYGGAEAGRAFDVFAVLQTRLRRWIDPRSTTKTALVYRAEPVRPETSL